MRCVRGALVSSALLALSLATSPQVAAGTSDPRAVGDHVWTRQFGTTEWDEAWGMATFQSAVYVAGITHGAFPGQTYAFDGDAYVRSLTKGGKHRWTREFGTGLKDGATGVAVNIDGVYVVGATDGRIPLQPSSFGYTDAFVRSYDHDGEHRWTRQFGTAADDEAWAVAVDDSGLYVVGFTEGALQGPAAHQGERDVFVRKYDHEGDVEWTRQFGSPQSESGLGVAVNETGVYVAGWTQGALPGQTSKGGTDGFLRSYTQEGEHRWTKQFGTAQSDVGTDVALRSAGVYLVGYTGGAFPGFTNAGADDAFLRSYTQAGKHRWTRQFGTDADDEAWGVTVDSSAAYVVGDTLGTFPGQTPQGWRDAFARGYDLSGEQPWTRQFGSKYTDYGRAAATSSGLYVAGHAMEALPGQTYLGQYDGFLRKYSTG